MYLYVFHKNLDTLVGVVDFFIVDWSLVGNDKVYGDVIICDLLISELGFVILPEELERFTDKSSIGVEDLYLEEYVLLIPKCHQVIQSDLDAVFVIYHKFACVKRIFQQGQYSLGMAHV